MTMLSSSHNKLPTFCSTRHFHHQRQNTRTQMAIDMTLPSTYTSSNRFAALSPKLSSPSPPPASTRQAQATKKAKKARIPSEGSNVLSGSTGPSSVSSSSSSLSDLGVSAKAPAQAPAPEKRPKHTTAAPERPAPVEKEVTPTVRVKKQKPKGATRQQAKAAVTPPIDWEIPRKTLHASIGVLVLFLNEIQPRSLRPLLQILTTGLVAVFTVDIFRLRSPAFAKLYEAHLGALMRESEKTQINGVIWYLVGVIFTLACYPRDVAVVAILTLSWSDTTASTIGRLWGRYTPPLPDHVPGISALKFAKRKSLAGFLAAVVTGAVIGTGFYGLSGAAEKAGADWTVLKGQHAALGVAGTSAVIGIGGAVVEALDLGFDDNLTLPILSGAIVWAWFGLTNLVL